MSTESYHVTHPTLKEFRPFGGGNKGGKVSFKKNKEMCVCVCVCLEVWVVREGLTKVVTSKNIEF